MDKISTIILAGSLIIVMLGMGLSLVLADFKRVLIYPKAILIGLTNQLILLPLVGFAIASAFPLRPEIAVGIMILAACPGGPTSNLITHLAKGNIALSVSLTALSSLITIFTIPLVTNMALNHFLNESKIIQLDVIQTIVQIMVIILIPVSIGMIVRHYKPDFAQRMAKPVRKGSAIVITLVIIGILIKEKDNLLSYFEEAGVVSLLLNAASMLIGYYSSRIFNIHRESAISISIESGIQNGTLAITVAVVLLGNSAFAIAPAIYSILMFFTGGLAIYLANRKEIPVEKSQGY